MIDQGPFAGHVSLVHRPDLGHGHVRLVDDEQEVLGEVVEQTVGGTPPRPAVKVHRIVLDARARADLAHHLDVIGRAHPEPLRLEHLPLLLEGRELLLQLGLDASDRPLHPLGTGDIVRRREDIHLLLLADDLTRQWVQRVDLVDLVAEELDADRQLFVHRDDLDGVAAHPEGATREGEIVARVLHPDELAQ